LSGGSKLVESDVSSGYAASHAASASQTSDSSDACGLFWIALAVTFFLRSDLQSPEIVAQGVAQYAPHQKKLYEK